MVSNDGTGRNEVKRYCFKCGKEITKSTHPIEKLSDNMFVCSEHGRIRVTQIYTTAGEGYEYKYLDPQPMTDKEKLEKITNFANDLIKNSKPLPDEFVKFVDEDFWGLV